MIDTNIIQTIWPIFFAIAGFFIHKFIPYITTKIIKCKYYNIEMAFYLIEYELVGIVISQVLVWGILIYIGNINVFFDYLIISLVLLMMYIFGIVIIIKKMLQKGKHKYLTNILLGILMYGIVSVQLFLKMNNRYKDEIDIIIYLLFIAIISIQWFINQYTENEKKISYNIYITNDTIYSTQFEPIKKDNYYYINIADNDNKITKQIQILAEKIEKIERIITYLNDSNV